MALTPRQVKRYVSNATIYRRQTYGSEVYTKIAEHIPCAIATTSNYDELKAIVGLLKEDSVQTSDFVHFQAAQDVRAEDVLFIEEDSVQRAGEWYQTTGAAEVHEFRANARKLFINNTAPLTPEQIAA